MIQAQAMAARMACARMTMLHLTELHDSVERACGLAARSQWDRKASAHAEIFTLLADVADDSLLAPLLTRSAGHLRELMLAGPPARRGWRASSAGNGKAPPGPAPYVAPDAAQQQGAASEAVK